MPIVRCLILLLAMTAVSCSPACPLQRATYRLDGAGPSTLRIGPAPDGEMILRLGDGGMVHSVALSQVIDQISLRYLDASHNPAVAPLDQAPPVIEIGGLSRISDIPDGEWRLATCGGGDGPVLQPPR
jgi:hypothetical protein